MSKIEITVQYEQNIKITIKNNQLPKKLKAAITFPHPPKIPSKR